jgi:hypothetical protein
MSSTIKIGWLKDKNGEKFAPKTLTSQVQTSDGTSVDEKFDDILDKIKNNEETIISNKNTTQTELDTIKVAIDNHAEDSDIHVTTEDKAKWDNKSDFSGKYEDLTGKPTDLVTKTYVDTEDDKLETAISTHTENGDIHVTTAEKQAWNAKSNFSGKYSDLSGKPDLSVYATKTDVDATKHTHYEDTNSNRLTDGKVYNSGDTLAVKTLISDGKYSYTGYVYDGNAKAWKAMDGNYSAKNVYFDENMTVTTEVGCIKLTNGHQGTIPSKGKNLIEVFDAIWSETKNPSKTNPSVSVTLTGADSYEIGTTVTGISYTVTFNDGKYTYGPEPTGSTATSWTVTDSNGGSYSTSSGNLPDITVTDTTNFYVSAKANYSDGYIPVTNKGNSYPDAQIKSDTTSTASSSSITGYRNTFWGTLTSKSTLTSDTIRGLTGKSGTTYGNGSTFTINIPAGCLRVVFAYPETLRDVTKVLDENDSSSNIVSSFTKSTLSVSGANKSNATSYKVYTLDFANAYNTSNKFHVTI